MQEIYFYPNNEEASYVRYIINEFIRLKILDANFVKILDDKLPEISINSVQKDKNKLILIYHFDSSLYKKLYKNASGFKRDNFIKFASRVFNLNLDFNELKRDNKFIKDELFNLALCFIGYFRSTHKSFLTLKHNLSNFMEVVNEFYKNLIGENIDVICYANIKYTGNIAEICKQKNLKVTMFFENQNDIDKIYSSNNQNLHAPYWQIYHSNIAKFFITSHNIAMPLKNSSYKILTPHAFIYPIASLVQRQNGLDELYFKKMSRYKNKNIVCASSKSNYEIFKRAFGKNTLKAGYPSFDLQTPIKNTIPDKICIAINDMHLLYKIKDEIIKLLDSYTFVFRPHPLLYKWSNLFESLMQDLSSYKNFIYDDNKDVINHLTCDTFCVISDSTSLSYTYPITFRRPAILCLEYNHTYKIPFFVGGNNTLMDKEISFFNKDLHILYDGNLSNCIKTAKQFDTSKIDNYIKDEVYNYKHSSEFITDFIIKHSKEHK